MVNIFKPFEYDINLNPTQVIGRIKSKTLFSNRISGSGDEFEGEFHENRFKIHFLLPGNILVGNSHNPVFFGIAHPVGNYHTQLKIKMRPNALGYGFCVFPAIFLLIEVLCLIFQAPIPLSAYIAISIISFGFFFVFFLGVANTKYKDMKLVLEELFKDELM